MSLAWTIAAAVLMAAVSLLFSALTRSFLNLSRTRLADLLGKKGADRWFEPITDHLYDFAHLAGAMRRVADVAMGVLIFACFHWSPQSPMVRYGSAGLLCLCALAGTAVLGHTIARQVGTELVVIAAPLLSRCRGWLSPVLNLAGRADKLLDDTLGDTRPATEDQAEEDILAAVEEGEKEGVVDEQGREMIESVIESRDTTAGQIMTPRQQVVAVPVTATLAEVRAALVQSGHSRLPLYEGSMDHIVGVILARDLLKYLGVADEFDCRRMARQAFFVPESRPLRDLLVDFRLQKVQLAVVLDEYSSVTGIVSFEDIVEELLGDVTDEHEKSEPTLIWRVDDRIAEADARIRIADLNRLAGLSLPEDAGYETLGGFLTSALGRIPERGTTHERSGVKFTVMEAEPQRVRRVRIELPGLVRETA